MIKVVCPYCGMVYYVGKDVEIAVCPKCERTIDLGVQEV